MQEKNGYIFLFCYDFIFIFFFDYRGIYWISTMCEGNFTSIQNYLALKVTVINKLNDTRNKFNIHFYFCVFIYIYTYISKL